MYKIEVQINLEHTFHWAQVGKKGGEVLEQKDRGGEVLEQKDSRKASLLSYSWSIQTVEIS